MKCLEDGEGVAFQLTKFRTRNDVDLFLHLGFKISIANVSGPNIEIIESRKTRSQIPQRETMPE